jgi:hypothetical protein
MQQLTEMRVGSSKTYTVDGFKIVLNALEQMPRLTTLVMQLPLVKQLHVNRGAEL